MFNLRCLFLSVILVTVAARQKCGYQAANCIYDDQGNIDWKNIEKCNGPQVCGPGFVLMTRGKKRGCCEARETTPRPTSTSIDPCPYQATCRNRYVWLHEVCACVCPPYACPTGTYRGDDCDCLPDTTPTFTTTTPIYCTQLASCPADQMPDSSGCFCIPNPNWSSTSTASEIPTITEPSLTPCPDPGTCTNNWMWEPWSCSCVCPEVTCPPGTIDGGDCNCITDPNWSTTAAEMEITECVPQPCNQRSWYWNDETCQCELGCDIVKECVPGKKWNIFKCACVEACPGVECPENFVATEGSCECVCSLNDSSCDIGTSFDPLSCSCAPATCTLTEEDCSGPLSYLDYDLCECRRHPCDPVPCEAGEIINWEYCRCEPDPNCSSEDIEKPKSGKSVEKG